MDTLTPSPIYYSDGSEIKRINCMMDLRQSSREIQEGSYRLPVQLIQDDIKFSDLYGYWIAACVDRLWDYVWHKGTKEKKGAPQEEHNRIRSLFQQNCTKEDCGLFFKDYRNMLGDTAYTICRLDLSQRICDGIEKNMQGMPEYMKMRVKSICIFLRSEPDEIFEEGGKWVSILCGSVNARQYEDDRLTVKNGMSFDLDFHGVTEQGLYPRTLYNAGSDACTIYVNYQGEKYPVNLPPFGVLRAVFADREGQILVSLKGAVSFNDTTSAVVQLGDENGAKLYFHYMTFGTMHGPDPGPFLDASADASGGIMILTAREMYSTMGTMHIDGSEKELPMRCYGGGTKWARLYRDGRLESNQRGWENATDVIAVAEDGTRGLLFCTRDGAWDCRGSRPQRISEEMFFLQMMGRFQRDHYCEVVATQLMQLSINRNGVLEVVEL